MPAPPFAGWTSIALASGSDDRLDELPIGVFVPAIDELAERLAPVGSLVVDAREIQRTERIVCRTNDEKAGEAAVELLEHVAETRRLERGEMLAGAAAKVRATGAQLVGAALR